VYDYLIVGAGLFGATCARQLTDAGYSVLILEKNSSVGGHVSSKKIHGIDVHLHGPHIFHTNDKSVWNYVNRFTTFNHYRHHVKVRYVDEIYSWPCNLMTLYQLWGCTTPNEAYHLLQSAKVSIPNPQNLEEWMLSQVGEEIYYKFIYGYTKKQWQREPKFLPFNIVKRLPIRLTYDDNYFTDKYQGVPWQGYTLFVENIIDGVDIKLNEDFFDVIDWRTFARKLIYSGPIDKLFGYCYGHLQYRTLHLDHQIVDGDFQGVAQLNYTCENIPYTRIVEHKHFQLQKSPKSVITYEYPKEHEPGDIPYYSINDARNMRLYKRYQRLIQQYDDIIVGGRMGCYRYMDMAPTINMALQISKKEQQS